MAEPRHTETASDPGNQTRTEYEETRARSKLGPVRDMWHEDYWRRKWQSHDTNEPDLASLAGSNLSQGSAHSSVPRAACLARMVAIRVDREEQAEIDKLREEQARRARERAEEDDRAEREREELKWAARKAQREEEYRRAAEDREWKARLRKLRLQAEYERCAAEEKVWAALEENQKLDEISRQIRSDGEGHPRLPVPLAGGSEARTWWQGIPSGFEGASLADKRAGNHEQGQGDRGKGFPDVPGREPGVKTQREPRVGARAGAPRPEARTETGREDQPRVTGPSYRGTEVLPSWQPTGEGGSRGALPSFLGSGQGVAEVATASFRGYEGIRPRGFTETEPKTSKEEEQLTSEASIRELIGALRAPQVTLPTFEGDPLDYVRFIRTFEEHVEKYVPDDAGRLVRLIQQCRGDAERTIKACVLLPSSRGYRRARELLAERYGDHFRITDGWVGKLTQGSSHLHLREFADELRECYEALSALGALREMKAGSNLRRVYLRFPTHLQHKWRVASHDIQKNEGRRSTFEDMVRFAEAEAESECDPLFGIEALARVKKTSPTKSSYAVRMSDDECPVCCEKGHTIPECDEFGDLSPDERMRRALHLGQCFVCLKGNHLSRDCPDKAKCETCGRMHSSLLHDADWRTFRQKRTSLADRG